MTTMKRILAVVLAVMLIASIGIIGVSAANEEPKQLKITLPAEKKDFTYTVYHVATLILDDSVTVEDGKQVAKYGSYTMKIDDADVKAEINTAYPNKDEENSANLLKALDKANLDGVTGETLSYTTPFTTQTPGIYYAKVKDTPSTVKDASNAVFVWPQYTDNKYTLDDKTITFSGKATTGTDGVTKYFSDDDTKQKKSKSLGQGAVVGFTLEADVVGSAKMPLQSYEIWDKMSAGLELNKDSFKYYYLKDGEKTETDKFAVTFSAMPDTEGSYKDGTYFTVTPLDGVLDGEEFYKNEKVIVTYTATVTNNAVVGTPGNPNKDGLKYITGTGTSGGNDGPEVVVYTYEIQAVKKDGNTKALLEGAEFGLYKDAACKDEDEIATGTSDKSGKVVFKAEDDTNAHRVAPGTYYVKEKTAPTGYALSTAVFEVEVKENAGTYVFSIDIDNYPTKLPQTGGMGTMMFTIIGGMLVLLAGAMFVIVMRKRASVK